MEKSKSTGNKKKQRNHGKGMWLAASLAGLSVFGSQKSAHAQTDTWVGNNSANFSNGGWLGHNPPVSGDSLIFDVAGSSGTSLNNDLDSSTIFNSITFNASAPAYTISGNPITLGTSTTGTVLTAVAGTANQSFGAVVILGNSAQTFSLAGNVSFNGIAGTDVSSALVKTGAGTLTLNGPSTYSGGTTLSGGTTFISSSSGLGSGNLTLSGGTLQLSPDSGQAIYSGSITVQAGTTSGIGLGHYDYFGFTGNITGSGTLNLGLGGTTSVNETHLAGDDSGFTGNMVISGTNVRLDTATAGSASALFTINSGAGLQLYGAAGNTYSFGGLAGTGDVGIGNNNSATISVGDSSNASFGGVIRNIESLGNTGTAGVVSLVIVGPGTQTLTGTNTYTGPTTISGGTLQIGDGTTDGSIATTSGVSNSGTLAYDFAAAHNVAYPITGSGTVTVAGAGSLTFTTSQAYTGPTLINGGSLKLASGFTYSTSGITVGPTGTLATAAKVGVVTLLGSLSQTTGGTIDMRDGAISSFSIGNGLTLGGGTLGFDVGASGADAINLTGGSYSATGVDNVFLASLGGLSASTYNLITGAPGISLANFNLQTSTIGGFNASLSISGGNTLELTLASGTGTVSDYWNTKIGTFAASSFSQSSNGTGAVSSLSATTPIIFSSSPLNGTGAKVASLAANQSVKSVTVNDSSSVTINGAYTLTVADSSGITVTSGAGPVAINTSGLALGASEIWVNGSANPVAVSSVISGAGYGLTFGGGTFVLTGSNTYSGSTTVNADGVLQLGSGISGSDGSISTANLVDNGAVIYNIFNSRSAGYVMSGSGSVTKSGVGILSLTGSNTYTGGTIVNGGTLAINTDASLGDAANPLTINSGTVEAKSNISSGRPVTVGSSSSTILVDSGVVYTLNGIIGGSGTLNVTGQGTLSLNGSNTYSGGTNLTAGTTLISTNSALGTGSVNLSGGTLQTLDYNSAVIPNPLNVQTGTTSYIRAGFYSYFGFLGNITGSGTLDVAGRYNINEIHFDGDNSGFTGNFIVSGVNVRLDTATSGSANATFTINSGAGLELYGGAGTTYSLGGLAGTGDVGTGNGLSGTISVGNSGNSTFAGAIKDVDPLGSYTTGGILSLTKVGSGTQTLTGSNTYSGPTSVTAGTLAVTSVASLPSGTTLTVGPGATFALAKGSSTYAMPFSALTNNGTLDIGNNAAVFNGGIYNIAAITAEATAGYNNGAWNGSNSSIGAITSSTAAADTKHLTAVGVIVNDTTGTAGQGSPITNSLDGTSANDGDILVKYTYYGDTNLDGVVDGSDYSRIDNAYLNNRNTSNAALTGWYNGDFNYDGVINGSDYTLMDNAFNSQGASLASAIAAPTSQIAGPASAVPEPGSLSLAIGFAALLGRRRRRH
jgi:autotransporter-associated beta strand protein